MGVAFSYERGTPVGLRVGVAPNGVAEDRDEPLVTALQRFGRLVMRICPPQLRNRLQLTIWLWDVGS